MKVQANLIAHAETITDDNTGVKYEPASFDGGIGYVVTHPDGRQECIILAPTRWHEINPDNGAEGDTFIYLMTAPEVAAWNGHEDDPAPSGDLAWWEHTDNVIAYANHFEDADTPREEEEW